MALIILTAVFGPVGGTQRFAVPIAWAEEGRHLLQIQMAARPDALVEPEDITLSLTIENVSGKDAQNVYLSSSDGLLSEPIGRIAAGEKTTITRPHSVTRQELDSGTVTYIISHDDPTQEGSKVNYTVQASIAKSDLQPEAEFTRQFSSRYVTPGSTVTITYRIRNTGNVALASLQVQDALGDYTGRVDRLDVGESRTLTSRVTLTEEALSAATLSYAVESMDDRSFILNLADAAIEVAHSQIDAELSAGYSAFSTSTADVMLLLRNLGNVDYHNIRVSDDIYGGIIADNISVPCGGAPVEISSSYPIRGSEGFRWRVTGTSEAGDRIDFVTDTVNVEPREIVFPAEVTMRIEAQTPRIRRAGTVPFTLRIENAGDADVTNIVLSDALLGEIRNFAIIPAGGFIESSFSLDVSETTEYNFSILYTDFTGWERSLRCAPVEVAIASDGVMPEGAEQPFFEFTGNSIKIGGSSAFAVLLIVGSSLLLVLIITLFVASHRAKMAKRLRAASEKQKKQAAKPTSSAAKKPKKPDAKKP